MNKIDKEFWRGRKVFLTGHTGFKGSWLAIWMESLGAHVKGYALEPPTEPSLFHEMGLQNLIDTEIGDIRDFDKLSNSISNFEPEVILHLAAQPIVRYSYDAPLETYSVNVMGTANLLEASRLCASVKSIVCVTTDKCYENNEWVWGYREDEPMGGRDPYSSSKGCAELVISAYRSSFYSTDSVGVASARAGNVIGGGDWAKDRLVPDILRAFEQDLPVNIRNPHAIRPWQHVLEPLAGYMMLAQKLFESPNVFSEAWNFGPEDADTKPVSWIVERLTRLWPGSKWSHQQEGKAPHEASYLKLDISKAKQKLEWTPVWSLGDALNEIVAWHRSWLAGEDMLTVSRAHIENYIKSLEQK